MPVKYRQTHVRSQSTYNAWLIYFLSLPYLIGLLSKLVNGEFTQLLLISAVFLAVLVSAVWMGVSRTASSDYDCFHIRSYLSCDCPFRHALLWVFLDCVQKADFVCVSTRLREWWSDVSRCSSKDSFWLDLRPAHFHW